MASNYRLGHSAEPSKPKSDSRCTYLADELRLRDVNEMRPPRHKEQGSAQPISKKMQLKVIRAMLLKVSRSPRNRCLKTATVMEEAQKRSILALY